MDHKGFPDSEKTAKTQSLNFEKIVKEVADALSAQRLEPAKENAANHFTEDATLLRRKNELLKKQLFLAEEILNKKFGLYYAFIKTEEAENLIKE